VGFTLSLGGFYSVLLMGLFSLGYFIPGLIFCIIQQKRKKTKLGKRGIILNVTGIILTIALFLVIMFYIYPLLQNQLAGFA